MNWKEQFNAMRAKKNVNMKPLFNLYTSKYAPKQLNDLFDKLDESEAIMLQECFHDFAMYYEDTINKL